MIITVLFLNLLLNKSIAGSNLEVLKAMQGLSEQGMAKVSYTYRKAQLTNILYNFLVILINILETKVQYLE